MDSYEQPDIVQENKNWESLNRDLQEQILIKLPVSEAVKAASVCKQWKSIVCSHSFTAQLAELPQGKKPWFVLWGINELIHPKSLAFTFDPTAGSWFSVRPTRPPDFNRASLCGSHGLFFAFSGSKVCFAPTPMKMKWKQTSPAIASRCSALLGTFGCRFVVAGGVVDEADVDHRIVEIYDSSSDTWKGCDPVPINGFHDTVSSQWMTSASLGSKFFIADNYGSVAVLDVEAGHWSNVMNLGLQDLVSLFIVASNVELYAVAVCSNQGNKSLKVYRVDEHTMKCVQVSEMPSDLFSQFENADDEKETSLRCVGCGSAFYVYDESYYKGYPICMCDLTDGDFVWRQLPPIPATPQCHFNRVICCSTIVTPSQCLEED